MQQNGRAGAESNHDFSLGVNLFASRIYAANAGSAEIVTQLGPQLRFAEPRLANV